MKFILTAIESLADSAFGKMLSSLVATLYSWVTGIVDFLATWWIGISPLGIGEGTAAYRVGEIVSPFVAWVGIPALMIALVRAARNQGSAEDTTQIVNGLFRTVIFGAAGMAGTHLLMVTSSALAPWIYDTMTAGVSEEQKSITSMFNLDSLDLAVEGSITGLLIVCLPFMLIASVVQAMMALASDIVANVLGATLAVTAAASTTKAGEAALKRQIGWILSCAAFKPVAALFYGFGVSLVHGSNFLDSLTTDDSQNPMLGILMGTMCIILVCFTLPALVKLIVPLAGVLGSSGGHFMGAMAGAAAGATFQAFSSSSSSGTSTSSPALAGGEARGASLEATSSAPSSPGGGAASSLAAEGASGAATGGAMIAVQESIKTTEAVGNTAKNIASESAGSSSNGESSSGPSMNNSAPDTDENKGSSTQSSGDSSSSSNSANGGGTTDTGSSSSDVPESSDGSSANSENNSNGSGSGSSGSNTTSQTGNPSADDSASTDGNPEATQSDLPDTGSSDTADSAGSDSSSSTADPFNSSGSNSGTADTTGAAHTSGGTSASSSTPYITNSGYSSSSGPSGSLAQQYLSELARVVGEETSGIIQPEGADI